jgi:pimeloyl-ACP methyl ester carboxylesterase
MDIILIPGLWLQGSSWDEVTPPLVAAGHTVHPLTLPGMESIDADRSGISLRDHIDAVVSVVDSLPEKVVLVGHSGGGAIAHGVVDARPDRIARVVYVDAGPLGDGDVINDGLPVVDGEIPLPDWDVFDEEDLVDLTPEIRETFRALSVPSPKGVSYDKQLLSNPARYDVPVTVIACEFPSAMLIQFIDGGHPYTAELGRIHTREFIDLPTGHWPQFTKPRELGESILKAVDR